jgi:3-methyladenine DNA glycosylase AlkD
MARFGISSKDTLGVPVVELRSLAREIGKDHNLALALWYSGIHEARLLASMVDDPRQVSEAQMEAWVSDIDSWDVCDGLCGNLFDRTPFAWDKAVEWSGRQEEFVKRAGFVLMTQLAVHNKQAADQRFEAFFPLILREANDDRNFVKKAVNWALRAIGKRNRRLNAKAVEVARQIQEMSSRTARWIANDALRELTSEKITNKLKG